MTIEFLLWALPIATGFEFFPLSGKNSYLSLTPNVTEQTRGGG